MPREIERTRRVSELIHRELAQIITREMHDPRVRLVSITGVRVSKDLKHATVYISELENVPGDGPGAVPVLNRASRFLRYQLGQRLDLRVTPDLRFRIDESIKQGLTISSLIDRARALDDSCEPPPKKTTHDHDPGFDNRPPCSAGRR